MKLWKLLKENESWNSWGIMKGSGKVMRSKDIEKRYDCVLSRDNTGFDNSRKFWTAFENDKDDQKFVYADGWTLVELVENIVEESLNRNKR